jgi:hypothetical protein
MARNVHYELCKHHSLQVWQIVINVYDVNVCFVFSDWLSYFFLKLTAILTSQYTFLSSQRISISLLILMPRAKVTNKN